MNCANHADASAVAYCRTCGKALCANCTRPVKGVIYCEDCLGARLLTTVSPASVGFVAGTAPTPPAPPSPPPVPSVSSGPNPTVAGILAGFFPFGVGPVYTGQYAKGLAHLCIFALLVAGISTAGSHDQGALLAFSIVGLIFFIVYQIIDTVRSARAIQLGQPAPDPYGLSATFGAGTKVDTSTIPFGALMLILLGVLFLLNSMGVELGLDRFWPLILIAIGGWLLVRNWGLVGKGVGRCQCARCCSGRLMGPVVLLTLGFLFLFESLGKVGFGRTWPILLLAIGGVKLYQSSASNDGHMGPPAPPGDISVPPPPPPPPAPAAPSEVNHG